MNGLTTRRNLGKHGGNFDLVAPVYDVLSHVVFGRRLEQAVMVWLEMVPVGASVLVLGGGTGTLLKPLLARQPGRVLYLEASGKMIAQAARRMINEELSGQIRFWTGTEQDLHPHDRFDVIILPFVLDLFTESSLRQQMLPRLLNALKPDGMLLVTDFVRTEKRWQRTLLHVMIWFFRLTAGIEIHRLVDWQHLLVRASLTRIRQQPQVWGMVSAEVWRWNSAQKFPSPS